LFWKYGKYCKYYFGLSVNEGSREWPATDLISSYNFSWDTGWRARRRKVQVSVVEVVSAPAANKSNSMTLKFVSEIEKAYK
jgi:hypothetical protein